MLIECVRIIFLRTAETICSSEKHHTLLQVCDLCHIQLTIIQRINLIIYWHGLKSAPAGVDSATQSLLSLTPNPAINGLTINVGEQKSMISIFDLRGGLVLSKQIEGKVMLILPLYLQEYMVKSQRIGGKMNKEITLVIFNLIYHILN